MTAQDFAIEYPDMELEHMEENAREIEQEMMEEEWAASFEHITEEDVYETLYEHQITGLPEER